MTIYKYKIQITDEQEISMPVGSQLLHAGLDPAGDPCVWALVNPESLEKWNVPIFVYGTGNPIEPCGPDVSLRHVSTFNQGPWMWHVFTTSLHSK